MEKDITFGGQSIMRARCWKTYTNHSEKSVPPVSTVVEVSAMMPSDDIVIEVEATAYLPVRT